MSLQVVLGFCTIDLEQHARLEALKRRSYNEAVHKVNDRLAAVPRSVFVRYPRLLTILESITSAIVGADMAEVATARLAQL